VVNIIFEYEETWNHSLTCAIVAGYLAEHSKKCNSNDAFVAGLLHDIGFVILHQIVNEDESAPRRSHHGRLIVSTETTSGVSHGDAGFWMATKWQLPAGIAEAIRFHHSPENATVDPALSATVHAADVLCNRLQLGPFSHDGPLTYDQAAIDLIDFEETKLDREQLEKYCRQMRTDIDGGQSLEDFVSEIKGKFVEAMGDLPDTQRIILALYYYENVSFEEIGRVLKLDEGTVTELHGQSLTLLKNVLWNIQPQRVTL